MHCLQTWQIVKATSVSADARRSVEHDKRARASHPQLVSSGSAIILRIFIRAATIQFPACSAHSGTRLSESVCFNVVRKRDMKLRCSFRRMVTSNDVFALMCSWNFTCFASCKHVCIDCDDVSQLMQKTQQVMPCTLVLDCM